MTNSVALAADAEKLVSDEDRLEVWNRELHSHVAHVNDCEPDS